MYDEWTAAQESTTVAVDEHELDVAYYDEGSGPVVVLLHGIPTSSYLWRDVASALEDDYRVVAPDLVGYGNSDMRDGFDRSIRAQEAAVAGLLDELGVDSASVVAHDIGGGVALRHAVHRPDAVENLVLSNAVCYDSWPVEPIMDIALPSTARETSVEEGQEMLEELFRSTLVGDADDEFVEGMKAPWRSEEGVVSLSRDAVATNTNHTTEIDPADVEARTLLLWGADDEFQSVEYAERLEGDVERAELVGLDDATHWVMWDRPEAYREELRTFLAAE